MKYTIIENRHLTGATWLMRLRGDTSGITRPGQFVNVAVDGCFLRRPISICDWDDSTILLAYDVVGEGTEKMSKMLPPQELDILCPLGNGFDISVPSERPVLLGGGIGTAPLYGLAKALMNKGIQPAVVLGFASKERAVLHDLFVDLGLPVYMATVDGSLGTKGFVTDAYKEAGLDADYFYACGPSPMLRALCDVMPISGQLSLETRMACGFGVCACCAIKTTNGPAGVCKKGPVFKKEELIWE